MPRHRHHLVVLSSLTAALVGCATTSAPLMGERSPKRSRVTLAPLVAEDTIRLVPQAIEPMLPSADRIARVIAARLGDRATVDVHFCVSPSGRVVHAKLAKSSAQPFFDQAVMTDIVAWKFTALPGPDNLRTCQAATIVYYPGA